MKFNPTWKYAKSIATGITVSGARAQKLLKNKLFTSYLVAAGGGAASGVGTTAAAIGTTTIVTSPTLAIPGTILVETTAAPAGGTLFAAITGWLGIPVVSTVAISTIPAWAIPLAVGGSMVVLGVGVKLYVNRKEMQKS